ncbi:glutaredoxin family protein [Methanocella arvoryzae]|uniref:Glutaredoxin-like protein n=1 Tax=Methanocella arvoryzae (strain DSM 22066 / NBRC 105507 / MRE50) TaxID=351160 RepID=Q0W0R7_METAR|nr:glutaredoxin family protein [Methanocella arvoryzae]CAJ38026.1 glutaredoxin-like protein [Methanocella arvoryzae MRE50]
MVKISMYTLSTCPFCRKTKKYFRDRGIQFDYIDYDTADEKEQERIAADMMKHTDHIAFPFVRIGDTVVIGFNPDRYELLLKSEKSPATAS